MKKLYILIVILLTVLLIFGCTQIINLDKCNQISDMNQRDRCYWDSAFEIDSAEPCKNIASLDTKNNCYYELAWRTEDAQICEQIQDSNKESWLDECYRAVAEVTKNPKLCEKVVDEDWKNYCYASSYGDVSYCDKIISEHAKEECTKREFIYTNNQL